MERTLSSKRFFFFFFFCFFPQTKTTPAVNNLPVQSRVARSLNELSTEDKRTSAAMFKQKLYLKKGREPPYTNAPYQARLNYSLLYQYISLRKSVHNPFCNCRAPRDTFFPL